MWEDSDFSSKDKYIAEISRRLAASSIDENLTEESKKAGVELAAVTQTLSNDVEDKVRSK